MGIIFSHVLLNQRIYSQKGVIRRFRHCANTTQPLTQTSVVQPTAHLSCTVQPIAPGLHTWAARYCGYRGQLPHDGKFCASKHTET